MARVLIDDLTEELIRGDEEGGSVKLTLDGASVELDLTTASLEKLREVLKPYFEAGRFIPKPGTPRSAGGGPARSSGDGDDGPSDREIRDWAQANGHEVGDFGRLPGRIRDAYWRAHNGAAVTGRSATSAADTEPVPAREVEPVATEPTRPRPEQVEIAEDLLDRGVTVATIAQQTGMSVDQIRELKRDLDAGRAPAGVST